MPSCRPDLIPSVLYAAMSMAPRTVLDVGVGHGKWGVLLGEYLKYWNGYEPIVDGVEPYSEYRSPAYGAYRNVWNRDVMELLDEVGKYDLVLIIDVIEHLTREAGLKLLDAVKSHYIVTSPLYWSAQGASFGNERERHVSRWTAADFARSTIINDVCGRKHIMGTQ